MAAALKHEVLCVDNFTGLIESFCFEPFGCGCVDAWLIVLPIIPLPYRYQLRHSSGCNFRLNGRTAAESAHCSQSNPSGMGSSGNASAVGPQPCQRRSLFM